MPDAGKSRPMKTSRRQDDGAAEKMTTFERIRTEFGAWNTTTTTSARNTTSSNKDGATTPAPPHPPHHSQADSEASAPSRTKTGRAFDPQMHDKSHYSKFDTFIESLDAACDALPTPLLGSAGTRLPRAPNDCSSAQHGHSRRRKLHEDDRLRPSTEIVKEVKFADEVIEIGEPKEIAVKAREMRCSKRNAIQPAELAREKADTDARDGRAADAQFESSKNRSQFAKAATKVQSTYRGYKVRRGQPLKYLLVLNSVQAKLEELRQQFDAWKIAAWFPTDFTERVTMTESVMDLLLELDTLQAVPVVVREFRKRVAREVIKFQEEVDGFLSHNSKHGVLLDLTRPEGNAPQGKPYPKSSKAIRHRVLNESNMVENVNDPKHCRVGHWKEIEAGTLASSDVTSKLGSDCKSKISESPIRSSQFDNLSEQKFMLWSPADAQFDKASAKEKPRKEKQLESITELKKCVAPMGSFDIPVPPGKEEKCEIKLDNTNIGNRSSGKEYLAAASGQCPRVPAQLLASTCAATYDEEMIKHLHNSAAVRSWESTENRSQNDNPKFAVSINKQRSLETHANVRIHIPKKFRIANLLDDQDEGCETRHPETDGKLEYSPTKNWETEFPSDVQCDNLPDIDKRCISIEKSLALKVEQVPTNKERDLCAPAQIIRKELCNVNSSDCQTKFQALPTDVDYISTKDFRDGTIVPLLASKTENREVKHNVTATQLKVFKDDFQFFCADDYTNSSPKACEEDRIGPECSTGDSLGTKEMPRHAEVCTAPGDSLGTKEMPCHAEVWTAAGDSLSTKEMPCHAEVCTAAGEHLQEFGTSGRETTKSGESALLSTSEMAPRLVQSETKVNGTTREQPNAELENVYELCGPDDLETISSCSNCAAYPADCTRESWDCESGIREQMLHQTYALKGLVKELDDGFNARKGEDASSKAGYLKDEPWQDYLTGELQPCRVAIHNAEPNFARQDDSWKSFKAFEREAQYPQQREQNPDQETLDDSWKSFKTFEREVQYREESEQNIVQATLHDAAPPDVDDSSCSDSKESSLGCISPVLNEECGASNKISLASTESDSNLLLSKLLEDNKRLKEILKEVMKWNSVQASAMLTLSERLEEVKNKK